MFLLQADCDKYAYDLERAELQHQKAQGGLDKSQEEVARLQVELEKLYDKHDKTQMELRQTHTQLEKYKEETATLEAEVDRFAGRMGKYQVRCQCLCQERIFARRLCLNWQLGCFMEPLILMCRITRIKCTRSYRGRESMKSA